MWRPVTTTMLHLVHDWVMQQRKMLKNQFVLTLPWFLANISNSPWKQLIILKCWKKTRTSKNPDFSDNYDKTKPFEVLPLTQLHCFQRKNLNNAPQNCKTFINPSRSQYISYSMCHGMLLMKLYIFDGMSKIKVILKL